MRTIQCRSRRRFHGCALAALLLACLVAAPASADENPIKNGDFSSGLANWSTGVLSEGSFSGFPHITSEIGTNCAPSLAGKSHVQIDVPGGADGYVEQLIKVPAEPGSLTFLAWGNLDPVNVTISAVVEGTPKPLSQFVPVSLESGEGECSGATPEKGSVGLSAYAGKEIGLRVEATAGGIDGTIAGLTDFEIAPAGTKVKGVVETQEDNLTAGVKLTLTGSSDKEPEANVEQSTTSDSRGNYTFEVAPGNYSVTAAGDPPDQNGGTLAVRKAPTAAATPECDGTAKEDTCKLKHVGESETVRANFVYTECSATPRLVKGKEASGCPIIFIPGFLGSRIFCNTGEMWTNLPNPDFADLQLESDGSTNSGAPGSCAATAAPGKGEDGVVKKAGVADIYGGVLGYLNKIAPGHVYALPYDWRKSPLIAKEALGVLVDEILKKTHAKRVVLVGHSMGGLVLQSFISEPTNAEKVERAVTLGTPYWGAVKSHVALLTGKSNEVATETLGLDLFVKSTVAEETEGFGGNPTANDLHLAAQNMQGLFWLYPADEFGPWLQVIAPSYPAGFSKSSQIRAWVASLGANPQLISNAVAGHAAISGYPSNGVDFQVVAGAGTPTESALKIEENPASLTQPVTAWYMSGDGTVPLVSATEGASEGKSAAVPIHYVCKVGHVALPGDPGVQSRIEDFLLKGEAIKDPQGAATENCPYTGVSMRIFEPVIPEHGRAKLSAAKHATVSVQTATGALTIGQAAARGLVTSLQAGGVRLLATTNHAPVTIKISGSGVTVGVRSIKSGGKGRQAGNGPETLYGPASGTLTIGPTGVVKKGGKRLRATHHAKAPHTRARVTRHGKKFTVRLTASSPAGVGATYYRFGKGRPSVYRKPLRLSGAQL